MGILVFVKEYRSFYLEFIFMFLLKIACWLIIVYRFEFLSFYEYFVLSLFILYYFQYYEGNEEVKEIRLILRKFFIQLLSKRYLELCSYYVGYLQSFIYIFFRKCIIF